MYLSGPGSDSQIEGSRSEIEPGAKLLSISHVEMKINTGVSLIIWETLVLTSQRLSSSVLQGGKGMDLLFVSNLV